MDETLSCIHLDVFGFDVHLIEQIRAARLAAMASRITAMLASVEDEVTEVKSSIAGVSSAVEDLESSVESAQQSIEEIEDSYSSYEQQRYIDIDLALGGLMYYDETEVVTLRVLSIPLGTDYTSGYTFAVTRDSGDSSSDAVWNAESAHQNCGTTFEITADDLNLTGRTYTTTIFYVTATSSSESITDSFDI